jgi:hypothetical protein
MSVRRIRVFPDWGRRWPLWENGTDKYTMEPSDYGLSHELTTSMRCWYDHWASHFDPFDGWDSEDNEPQSKVAGDLMVERLRAEVGPEFDVVDERR